MAKNVIIGQSGGPTAVINSSLAGVYKAACSLGADKVYGMKYGIEGLLKEELVELNVLLDDRLSIELLKRTPSSYLGSCRYKLPEPEADSTPYVKLFTLFDKYDICAVFYIGGNDSMDTIAKLSRYGAQVVLTGLDYEPGKVGSGCLSADGGTISLHERIAQYYPGTGDLFAAVVLGALLNGRALADACALAGEFVKDCIAYTAAQHTDPMHGVQFEKLLPRLFSCHENWTEV